MGILKESLAKRFEATTLKSIKDRLNGEPQLPVNPFTPEALSFDYSRLNSKYCASIDPNEELILYKGALRGYGNKGFLSLALNKGLASHVAEVKDCIEQGDDDLIRELFDLHTSYYSHTALLSATLSPERAQVFAPTYPLRRKENKTIYKIKVKASRCVVDCFNTGGEYAFSKELFILGAIFPEEITAVKMVNDDEHSELLGEWNGIPNVVRNHPDTNSTNRDVKDPSNWTYLIK